MSHSFVALPENREPVYLYDVNSGEKVRQVLWGDWLKVSENVNPDSDWINITWAWQDIEKSRELKIKRNHTSDTRPLEIAFVDVGQGDGAVLITPEKDENERIIIIDAGDSDHMLEFLKTRFMTYRKDFCFHAAINTHPDKDHYSGFERIFKHVGDNPSQKICFDKFYHSGVVEWPTGNSWEKLGGRVKHNNKWYLNNLVQSHSKMVDIFTGYDGQKEFPKTISAAIENDSVGEFAMLSTEHGELRHGRSWLPDFPPLGPRGYEIEIIGPFIERDDNDNKLLRTFDSQTGKTKNGHSVLLRLTFGDIAILFGGDLNKPAEKFLLQKYSGKQSWPKTEDSKKEMVETAKQFLRSDVMKSCHHGSSDVTDEFLKAVDSSAFVVSSGETGGHVHPRPDLLGRLGRHGRGEAPIILSTELQRSTREKQDAALLKRLKRNIAYKVKHNSNPQKAEKIAEKDTEIADDLKTLGRSNVDVDGTIYVKTDGQKLIAAFKKETNSLKDKWFYFEYRIVNRELVPVDQQGH